MTRLGAGEIPSVAVGLMRIAQMKDEEIRELVGTALEVGANFFDHAQVYGGADHVCETRFGEAMKLSAADRGRMMIQTKTGIRRGVGFDFSTEEILSSAEGSLKALRTEYIDVLLLHRPDALVEPEEVAAAFDKLYAQGKVRHFGVSNQTPGQIELLKTAVKQPLVFNQVQLSIAHANLIAQGVAANMGDLDQSISRDVGLLDYSRIAGMTLQAWSPFQQGFFKGVFVGDRKNYPELNDVMDELAKKYGVTPTGIAVAWIVRHPANIQVVLGTTKPSRVRESAAGADIRLTREEWYRLFKAAGHTVP
jgi:predicted oxidoreductase